MWGAIASLGASAIGALGNKHATDSANDTSIELAKSKYQWTRNDLEKAGYNPMLATGINPQAPTIQKADIPQIDSSFIQAENSAKSIAKQAEKTDAEIQIAKEQARGVKLDNEIKTKELKYNPQYTEIGAKDKFYTGFTKNWKKFWRDVGTNANEYAKGGKKEQSINNAIKDFRTNTVKRIKEGRNISKSIYDGRGY